jgi:hypothetical protein
VKSHSWTEKITLTFQLTPQELEGIDPSTWWFINGRLTAASANSVLNLTGLLIL